MNIVLGIATMVMMAVVIYLNVRLNNHEADTNLEIEGLKTKYDHLEKLDGAIDNGLDLAGMQIATNNDSIKEITAKLEEIAKDIKRLDERTEVDHKNLVDIRTRYILYKEPTVPVINGGVPWAKDHKVGEDNE